jgi:hypothetical protein
MEISPLLLKLNFPVDKKPWAGIYYVHVKQKGNTEKAQGLEGGEALEAGASGQAAGDRQEHFHQKGTVPITTDEWLKLARAMGEEMEYFFTAASTNIEIRERLLLKFYRSLNHTEQRDLLGTIRLILKGMRRKRVHGCITVNYHAVNLLRVYRR